MSMKNSSDTIWNRTSDLPICSTVGEDYRTLNLKDSGYLFGVPALISEECVCAFCMIL